MHVETYPVFLTPRDKEPSLSSSEEKSLEFGWLARKITRKQEYIRKTEQVLCLLILYMIYLSITYFYMMDLLEQAPSRVPLESHFLVFTREFI